jgi:hypothetical protein
MYQKSRSRLIIAREFFISKNKGHKKTHLAESGELIYFYWLSQYPKIKA